MIIAYIFSILFVTPKTRFLQLQVSLLLTNMNELSTSIWTQEAACALSFINLYLYIFVAQPMSPLLKPCAVEPGLYFSTLCHCVSHKLLVLHRKTTYCCYLHRTVVMPHESKQKKSRYLVNYRKMHL